MSILMLTIGFSPNVGGIETHFIDYLEATAKRRIPVTVLTYQPLETPAKGKTIEKFPFVTILRLPIAKEFFYKLVRKPFLEFLYLFPELFIITPFIIIQKRIDVIHAHGIIAGFVGTIWSTILRKKLVVSTHSIYQFPEKGLYRYIAQWIFQKSYVVLALSEQSKKEIENLGISKEKIHVFTYWVNQQLFKPHDKQKSRELLKIPEKFAVLFVGRLIAEKGILPLLDAAKKWNKSITLLVAGVGPLESKVKKIAAAYSNIIFLGNFSQKQLPILYNSADVLIVPSVHEEGFGRVLLEALACGIPVIASKRGGIPEAIDNTVGYIIGDINSEYIKKIIEYCYGHKLELENKSKAAAEFVKKRYSEKNVEVILKTYE